MTAVAESWEARLVEACASMIEALPADELRELLTLRDLDPEGYRGLTVVNLDDDFIEVALVGRRLGAIRRAWLFEDAS